MKAILIIGASGHGKVLADIARQTGYDDIRFLDDNAALTCCGSYPVVGNSTDFRDFHCDFIVAIGHPLVRQKIMDRLEAAGKRIATLIHPHAVIGENVSIGMGSAIIAGAVINPCTAIGKGCIVNTCASVDHDCVIGDYVHIAVGSHLCGTVSVGDGTWIGAGATVSNNVSICSDCMIGAGAVVIKNIEQPGTYVGIPAERIK